MEKNRSYANRGKGLEKLIDKTNNHYRREGIAEVNKIPTPFKVMGMASKTMSKGFFERGYLVDYIGVVNGHAICFDAKETKVETRFDLKNIHNTQMAFMENYHRNGATAFLLINFKSKGRYFIINYEQLQQKRNNALQGGKKSIPFEFFEENCKEIYVKNGVLEYL